MNNTGSNKGKTFKEHFEHFAPEPPDDILENIIRDSKASDPTSGFGKIQGLILAVAIIAASSFFAWIYFSDNDTLKADIQKEQISDANKSSISNKIIPANNETDAASGLTKTKQKTSVRQTKSTIPEQKNNTPKAEAPKENTESRDNQAPHKIKGINHHHLPASVDSNGEDSGIIQKDQQQLAPDFPTDKIELTETAQIEKSTLAETETITITEEICKGEEIILTAPEGINYSWNTGSTAQSILVKPEESTAYSVIVDQVDREGTEVVIHIDVLECNIFIPNAFSPNGDGLNDKFRIKAYNAKDFRMQILSRWGQMLYDSSNPSEGWDGRTLDGDDCPTGVYIYSAVFVDEANVLRRFTGSVTLIR